MPRVSKKVIEEQMPERSGLAAFIAILVGVGIVVVIAAVMIGKSDSGEINVSATINQSNEINAANGTGAQVNAANPALQDLPNGGLVPQENQQPTTPVTESVPMSTTTEDVASTTPESTGTENIQSEESIEDTPEADVQ
jgi:hypothetical protein